MDDSATNLRANIASAFGIPEHFKQALHAWIESIEERLGILDEPEPQPEPVPEPEPEPQPEPDPKPTPEPVPESAPVAEGTETKTE